MTANRNQAQAPAVSEINEHLVTASDLTLDEIAGQEQAVKELKELIRSIKYKPLYNYWVQNPPKGVLLTGPTGVGKTASVRAVAAELSDIVALIDLPYMSIASKFVDHQIEKMQQIFKTAEDISRERHVLLFIDEIEAVVPKRTPDLNNEAMKRVTTFLQWMDGGFVQIQNITVLGATNHPELMDDAMLRPGRFDRTINFDPLSQDAIIKGLTTHFGKRNLRPELVGDIDWTAVKPLFKTGSVCGADLPEVVSRMVTEKINEHLSILRRVADVENLKMEVIEKHAPEPICTNDLIATVENYLRNKQVKAEAKQFGFAYTS